MAERTTFIGAVDRETIREANVIQRVIIAAVGCFCLAAALSAKD
jgi:hypothetical protein